MRCYAQRRLKRLTISPAAILMLISQLADPRKDVKVQLPGDYPDDMQLVSSCVDPSTGCVTFFVTSDSFPELYEGALVPQLMPFSISVTERIA